MKESRTTSLDMRITMRKQALEGSTRRPTAPPLVSVPTIALMALMITMIACDRGREPSVGEEAAAAAVRGVDRARQERTLGRLEAIRLGLERYQVDHGSYPAGGSIEILATSLSPVYMPRMDVEDAWGNTLSYASDGAGYTVVSSGDDGLAGTPDDIRLQDGAITSGS